MIYRKRKLYNTSCGTVGKCRLMLLDGNDAVLILFSVSAIYIALNLLLCKLNYTLIKYVRINVEQLMSGEQQHESCQL